MARSQRAPRYVTAAKRALKKLAAATKQTQTRARTTNPRSTIDEQEAQYTKQRRERLAETKKRNAGAQSLPRNKRHKKSNSQPTSSYNESLEFDKNAFFNSIDSTLCRVCGSCGELCNSASAVLKKYDSTATLFDPLRNGDGKVEIISEGLVEDESDADSLSIWLCDRCYRAIRSRKTPKFSRCSGFRIGEVPEELAGLNRIEARLIGLGVSFTTCVNLYRDGQEFTRGNAINYWNEPGEAVRELPRPLRSCGVVFLAAKSEQATNYFRVRPKLVRRALSWLIANNPLYEDVTISEPNMHALEELDAAQEIPTIPVTDDEVQELREQPQNVVNRFNVNDDATAGGSLANVDVDAGPPGGPDSGDPRGHDRSEEDIQSDDVCIHETPAIQCDPNVQRMEDSCACCDNEMQLGQSLVSSCAGCTTTQTQTFRTCSNILQQTSASSTSCRDSSCVSSEDNCNRTGVAENNNVAPDGQDDVMENLTESFELEGNQGSKESEIERIMSAAGLDASDEKLPIGELRCRGDPIDEYKTKMLMQCCFPTLFPDGYGGYHPLEENESRIHEYGLAEYSAHLMKWHDRRFVIHGNFKFFCLNIIQRRQIDGLVRRVGETDKRTDAINAVGPGREHSSASENDHSIKDKEELHAAVQVLDSLKPYFRVVRGSGLYWSNARDDLMSMIGNRVLPTRWPTFFLTLSAADTIWPDYARACDPTLTLDQCRNLSFQQRRKYLNENPDICARHFSRRFQSFFDNILCGKAKPLGKIVDHFWRVEFQQRGSPHIHCLLWIKDAPDVLKLSESEEGRKTLAEFVDRHISVLSKMLTELDACACPTCTSNREENIDILALRPPAVEHADWDCDLASLVQRVQQHQCSPNSSCRKKGNECRFGFPKPLQEQTAIETSVASDGTPSLKVHLKRQISTINNYSPHILSCWRANMDLQLIGNSYGAAEYAGAYISKAEPDTIRFRRVIAKAVQRCDPNLSYHSVLKRVANATLSVREVGAPEAIYILLRNLQMHSKSRCVQKVKVLRHNLRYYRVEPHGVEDLVALADTFDPDEIRIERIERAYINRPATEPFESMSFATFIEEYDLVDFGTEQQDGSNIWSRLDGEGWIKRRAKAVVVQKSPWIRPDTANPNFCFSEVFLYVPWRSVSDLPIEDEECIAAFFDVQDAQLDGELQKESNAKLARQHKLDLLKNSHEACSVMSLPPSEYVFISRPASEEVPTVFESVASTSDNSPEDKVEWSTRHNYSPETVLKARDFMNSCLKPWIKEKKELRTLGGAFRQNERKSSHYQYPIADCNNTLCVQEVMAESQWIPFALAMKQARARLRESLDKSYCKPLQMIINGEGGSGKSWLIRHIVKDVHNVFGEHTTTRRTSKRVLLLAHQGTAAFNIKGTTLCSALGFSSFSKSAFSIPYKSLTETKSGPAKLKNLQQQYKDVHLVIIDEFSMISSGMLYWIDKRMREIWPSHSDELFGGRDVYFTGDMAQLDPVVPYSLATPLTKISNDVQRRGRMIWTNIEHVCMLTSQQRGKLDPEWFSALRRLRQKKPTQADIDLFNSRCLQITSEPEWTGNAKHIAYKNVDVAAANEKSINAVKKTIFSITSQHFVQQKRLATKRDIPAGTVQALVNDAQTVNSEHDRVVANKLKLCIGAPVTLTYNMAQPAGLCNGTNAVVYDFMFVSGSELPVVLVQITDTYLGPSLLDDVPNIVPIVPKEVSWGRQSSDLRVVRRGIPLRLAYAMTVHKVQGLTCAYVVFHSNSIPSIAFAYVALSRVRHRNSMIISHKLTLQKMTASPEAISAFKREEDRVLDAVANTTQSVVSVVDRMKAMALQHNTAIGPR